MADSIKVAVRVRPFNDREKTLGSTCIVAMSGNTTMVTTKPQNFQKTYDYSYWSHNPADAHFVDQQKVFSDIGTVILDNALKGLNGCLFAYGQTGAGKTHSVMGSDSDPGIIPQSVEAIFKEKEESNAKLDEELHIWISFVEIYNESVRDLLSQSKEPNELKVIDQPNIGISIPGLAEHECQAAADVDKWMNSGMERRRVGSTNMNATSSRSHAVFIIKVQRLTGEPPKDPKARDLRKILNSRINLVDLAGSEKLKKSGTSGDLMKEGVAINQSLTALGLVIKELSEAMSKGKSVNSGLFRQSKLTFLLKDSLAGNSKTFMIAAISPSSDNCDETLSTLRFASNVKMIKTVAIVNVEEKKEPLQSLKDEASKLRKQMANGQAGTVLDVIDLEAIAQMSETPAEEQFDMDKKEDTADVVVDADSSLLTRVDNLLLDCGIFVTNDESLSNRGRRLASELGLPFVSIVAVVEEAESCVYGFPRVETSESAAANRSSATPALATATAVDPTAVQPSNAASISPITSGEPASIYSCSGVAICFVMPFVCLQLTGYTFACASLYFRENGWPLWHLGCLILVCFICRVAVNTWMASFGAWFAVPVVIVGCLCGCQSLVGQIWPQWYGFHEANVILQLFGVYGTTMNVALQGILYSKFTYSEELRTKASRLQNMSVVLGYGTGPFVGGLLFDLGSWKLVTVYHVAGMGGMLILFCLQAATWRSFTTWRQKRSQAAKVLPTGNAAAEQQTNHAKGKVSLWSRPEIARPAFLICFGFFCNEWSYATEWMLFAIYFREQYGWQDAVWAGVAQMAGDLMGAAMLVANSPGKKKDPTISEGDLSEDDAAKAGDGNCFKSIWTTLTTRPYHLAFLLFCWTVCDVALASPILGVAVTSQVVMGTLYVFFTQWSTEMNMFLAAGDDAVYLALQSMVQNVLSVAVATSGPTALFLYENIHPVAPFLLTGSIAFIAMIMYTIGFTYYPAGQHQEQVVDNRVHEIHIKPERDDYD